MPNEVDEISHIKEMIGLRFSAHDRETELLEKSFDEFKKVLESRLDGLNHVKEQTDEIKRDFLRSVVYDQNHTDLVRRVTTIERSVWMLAGAVALVGMMIPIIIHFMK